MLTLLGHTGNGAVVLSNLECAPIQLFPFGYLARPGHYLGHFGHASPQWLAGHARGVSGYRRFFGLHCPFESPELPWQRTERCLAGLSALKTL
jgi:hypothetical protein